MMGSLEAHNGNLYPDALAVIQKIINITKNENCLFRGEPSINVDFPCASALYRQLKKENVPEENIKQRLKEKQDELIQDVRKYKTAGDNNLEKLMFFQHHRVKTNLLDFTKDYLFALFFACSNREKIDEDGRIVVKRIGKLRTLATEGGVLPDDEIVLLEPHEDLQRARDQHGVLLHAPEGRISLSAGETVIVRREYKEEILDLLENMHNKSDKTIFGDVYGEIDRRNQEDKKREREITQPRTGFQGLAESGYHLGILSDSTGGRKLHGPVNSQEISIMGYYEELLRTSKSKQDEKFLKQYADGLIHKFTNVLNDSPNDFEAYYNRAYVYKSKPDPDYERAIEDYTRVIDLSPYLTTVHISRGNVYSQKPDPDYNRAIEDYTRELTLNPDDALAYYNLGTAQFFKSNPDYNQAISNYTQALELDPDCKEAYYNRANVYAMLGDCVRAREDYDATLNIDSNMAKLSPSHELKKCLEAPQNGN